MNNILYKKSKLSDLLNTIIIKKWKLKNKSISILKKRILNHISDLNNNDIEIVFNFACEIFLTKLNDKSFYTKMHKIMITNKTELQKNYSSFTFDSDPFLSELINKEINNKKNPLNIINEFIIKIIDLSIKNKTTGYFEDLGFHNTIKVDMEDMHYKKGSNNFIIDSWNNPFYRVDYMKNLFSILKLTNQTIKNKPFSIINELDSLLNKFNNSKIIETYNKGMLYFYNQKYLESSKLLLETFELAFQNIVTIKYDIDIYDKKIDKGYYKQEIKSLGSLIIELKKKKRIKIHYLATIWFILVGGEGTFNIRNILAHPGAKSLVSDFKYHKFVTDAMILCLIILTYI
ncbi:hypothetical protein [Spiroplasma attinicola]|uniref:hypothetical protein n=1 Tax=Spiroplasma attinicola TaxID=2904537 RepID=UPI002022AA37|nr:hypothetical protein [Spiroplasma sp. JKS002670]MCL8209897.1 hypothetical protein [Spiroplasma sp. JKS002670]